jgi:hypothetical protein
MQVRAVVAFTHRTTRQTRRTRTRQTGVGAVDRRARAVLNLCHERGGVRERPPTPLPHTNTTLCAPSTGHTSGPVPPAVHVAPTTYSSTSVGTVGTGTLAV